MRRLADDRDIVTKQAEKGSCVVVWCSDETNETASKKRINNWKTKQYTKISALKKHFFQIWLIKAIKFFRALYM